MGASEKGSCWRGCSTRKGNATLEDYPSYVHELLRTTGPTGETRDGFAVIRALHFPEKFGCDQGHLHAIDWAIFLCPHGPDPQVVIRHGTGPGDPGLRCPHCPNEPQENYYVAIPPEMRDKFPRRMQDVVWACRPSLPIIGRSPGSKGKCWA